MVPLAGSPRPEVASRMARSLYTAADRQALLARLDQLRPEARPLWGAMTAPKMVAHLTEAFRMPHGELQMRPWFVPFRGLVRRLVLYVLPFPKSAPTAPELLARAPVSWPEDLARLRSLIADGTPPDPAVRIGEHPIFGALSPDDWGVLLYKHTDHHLRQFGL